MTLVILYLVKHFGGFLALKKLCTSVSNMSLKKIYFYLYRYYSILHCSSISINSKIGENVVFPHNINGIFISGEAVIGSECVIFQGVTIGSNTLIDSKSIGAPRIGNSCYIGAGAKIIGRVVIGDNVRVGANSVVTTDIPSNCTVVGQSSLVITPKKQYDNKFYSKNNGQWGYYKDGQWVKECDRLKCELLKKAFDHVS